MKVETIIMLRLSGNIKTIKSNLSVFLENSSLNGIQIDAVQAINNKNKQGNRVTIKIGGKQHCTDLCFRTNIVC